MHRLCKITLLILARNVTQLGSITSTIM